MGGVQKAVWRVVSWPATQLRRVSDQVSERLQASDQAARARFARARAENAKKVIEVSPPSSRGPNGPNG